MKKRILSLILALSMVLSVLPLGAFAEGSLPELVMGANGLPDCSNGTSGNGWSYDAHMKKLTLTSGPFDFSSTHPQGGGETTTTPVRCEIEIQQGATITGGTFNGEVSNNQGGNITNGTFEGEVINNAGGEISGGTFKGTVLNGNGTIFGGTFAGSVENQGSVTGGVFNGNAKPTGVTGGYPITVDAPSPDAKIKKVNDVSAHWAPYAYAGTIVTITADTEIFSLNGKPIGAGNCNSSQDSSDKKTVTFTMPDGNVVLGTGDLVMAGGYPVGSNNGTADCDGNGWTYSKIDASNPTGKLTLTRNSGTYDFSYTYPQNTSKGSGAEPVACAIEIQWSVEITGGIFAGEVTNEGTIKNGIFEGRVTSNGTIMDNGTFNGTVTNSG